MLSLIYNQLEEELVMRVDNIFEYFYGRKGNQLVIDEGKEVTLVTVRKSGISSEEMIMSFKYRNNEITVYVSKPQAELRLLFDKKITGLQRETFTPVESLDSTLLTYLGKFAEEMEETVDYKLFDWRD